MIDDYGWIIGLMRVNSEALGFIPDQRIFDWYIPNECYVMQHDERGRKVGYLLHGLPQSGRILTIQQHCIELDKRMRGYGETAFDTVLERARQAQCRAITLRCAEELPSNEFWKALGFKLTNVDHHPNRRKRAINVYTLDLWPTLWDVLPEEERP